jgi:hypothetical protein
MGVDARSTLAALRLPPAAARVASVNVRRNLAFTIALLNYPK